MLYLDLKVVTRALYTCGYNILIVIIKPCDLKNITGIIKGKSKQINNIVAPTNLFVGVVLMIRNFNLRKGLW